MISRCIQCDYRGKSMKNLVVTDRELSEGIFKNSIIVNLNNIDYSPCNGCCECLKNESQCHFKDDMSLISRWSNDCQLIIYITRVKYGCFDIPFKKMLERLVVNIEPFYTMLEGQSCHLCISQLKKKLLVIGYGNISEEEKVLFKEDYRKNNNFRDFLGGPPDSTLPVQGAWI